MKPWIQKACRGQTSANGQTFARVLLIPPLGSAYRVYLPVIVRSP